MPICPRCDIAYLDSEDHKCNVPKQRRDPWPRFVWWFGSIVIYTALSGLARACGFVADDPKELTERTAGEPVVNDNSKVQPTTIEDAHGGTKPSDGAIRRFMEAAKTDPSQLQLYLLKPSGDPERDVVAMFTALTGSPPTEDEVRIIREELAK